MPEPPRWGFLLFCQCKSETCPRACKRAAGCASSQGGNWGAVVSLRCSQHHLRATCQGVTPTHHHQDITIMASPWKPPLGQQQQVIPTTRTSPPGLHHWLLVLHVPKTFTGGCADPLELPSSWLGRRFPIGYKRSQACSRAWCHLGFPHWAAPKLLPQVMAQATCSESGDSPFLKHPSPTSPC